MAEETIRFNVVYDVEGIDTSVRSTQRLLYFMNASRLAVTDIQKVMSGPNLANIMWTSVQLTRVWTNLYRMINASNKEAVAGGALGVARRAMGGGGASSAAALGQGVLSFGPGGALGVASSGATRGLWATIVGFAAANPATMGMAAAALLVGGAAMWDIHNRQMFNDWEARQRQAAKNQGLEY